MTNPSLSDFEIFISDLNATSKIDNKNIANTGNQADKNRSIPEEFRKQHRIDIRVKWFETDDQTTFTKFTSTKRNHLLPE